jgi:riboflavin kinase/FMN adenylyltransferase
MIVYRGLDDRRLRPRPSAVAVGNFDGLHRGHRRILGRLCGLARRKGLRSLVLTFEPHPERALGKRSVLMIDTPAQRLDRLRATCVDAAVVIPFDRSFAGLGAQEFVRDVLRDRLGAREVVVGRGFRFGHDRRGDVALLRRLGRQAGLAVHAVPPAVAGGRTVSSTAVRGLLARGRVEDAARLLGRPYEVAGRVVPGRKRGRLLGYPTANLETANEILPEGIYVSEAAHRGAVHPSVTSIGTNPTFGPGPLTVETLLLDHSGSLYGAEITVRLLRRLRPPRAFAGADALAAAIGRDIRAARAWFSRRG